VGGSADGVAVRGEVLSPAPGTLTDTALLEIGYACVTAVVPVVEDPSLELSTVLGPGILAP
jgi:hypothetical protein